MNRIGALAIALCACVCLACARPSGAAQQSASTSAASASASSRSEALAATSCTPATLDRPNLLIDDFDANDGRPPRSAGRIAYWWSASDGTGGTLQPDPTAPDDTSRPREGKALHFVARDFEKWGALVGVSLFWSEGAMRCPLNASGYAGFEFRAKGSGSLAAQLLTRDTANARGGGRCETRCFDHYQRVVQITPEWSTHAIRWEDLRQLGFGQAVPLAPEYTVGISFQAHLADLPVDVWIDDLEFIPRSAAGERSP